MHGNLSQACLPDLLQTFGREQGNGVLQVMQDDVKKQIYFGHGSMVFARSTLRTDRLGELLVRKGELSRANLALVSNKMRARRERLGTTVVSLGLMSAVQVQARLEEQVREIIHSLFTWEKGAFRFESQRSPVEPEALLDLPTVPIILEGTRRMEPEAVRKALGDRGRAVSYSKDPCVIAHYANLTPQEGFVLSRVDGAASLDEIVSISPLTEDKTLRCLHGLLSAGFLEIGSKTREVAPSERRRQPLELFHEIPAIAVSKIAPEEAGALSSEEQWVREEIEAKHASLSTGTFYDWLEVRKTASTRDIKKAFSRLVKKYHPDRHRSKHLDILSPKLGDIVAKVTRAHETLGKLQSRRRYDNSLRTEAPRGEAVPATPRVLPSEGKAPPSRTEKMADCYYREARRYFAKRDFHEVVKLMEEVVELDPGKVRYHCLLAQALARNPRWRKSAEEHFKTALGMDRFDIECLTGLAELYERIGFAHRARALYAEAAAIDPANVDLWMKHGSSIGPA